MSAFLILGGTGKTGRRVAQHLRSAGHTPRLASRGTGGDVVFDWREPATYPAAVAGVDGVFVVVLTEGAFDDEVLELSGPEAITFDDAVAAVNAASGDSAVFVDESDDEHIARLRAAGTPETYVAWRMAMLGGIRSGADARISDGVDRVLRRPPTSFAAWATREAGPAA